MTNTERPAEHDYGAEEPPGDRGGGQEREAQRASPPRTAAVAGAFRAEGKGTPHT